MHNFLLKFKSYFLVPLIMSSVFVTSNTLSNSMDKVSKHSIRNVPNLEQVKCLATNIFYEARTEPLQGQAAVARVVVNRVKHGFGATPCKVIYQVNYFDKGNAAPTKVCQFSWVCEGNHKPNERDPHYRKAMQIAYDVYVLDRYKDVVSKNTLFFHATHVSPDWKYKKVKKIGNHIFYSRT